MEEKEENEGEGKRLIGGADASKANAISDERPKRRSPRGFNDRSDPNDVTDLQRQFLDAYELVGTITGAAREIGIARTTHATIWMRNKRDGTPKDKRYVTAFTRAEESSVEVMISEARRRAIVGVEHIERWKGEEVGRYRKYSDNLLMFLIKARRPEYRERHDVNVSGGQLLQVELTTIRQIHSEVEKERKSKQVKRIARDLLLSDSTAES